MCMMLLTETPQSWMLIIGIVQIINLYLVKLTTYILSIKSYTHGHLYMSVRVTNASEDALIGSSIHGHRGS
jgi:hypothetical protein